MDTETIRSLLLDAGSDTPPAPGHTLVGRYELRRQLARTGFSVVFRALDHRLRRTVCVKIARPRGDLGDAYEVTRAALLREARTLGVLEAHGISAPRLIELRAWVARPFLVMTYIPGNNLALLRELGWISDRRAAEVVHAIARLLASVHHLGLVHHDVKPSNIQVRPDGSALLVDWGSSQPHGVLWSGEPLLVTPEFASPARLAGCVAPQNDVFALARTLEFALSNPHPAVRELVSRATAGEPQATTNSFRRSLEGLLVADRLLRLCGQLGRFDPCW